MEMNETIRAELVRLGWDPEKVLWGRRISGDVHGARLELPNGQFRYVAGPFVAVHGDGQMAEVRFG